MVILGREYEPVRTWTEVEDELPDLSTKSHCSLWTQVNHTAKSIGKSFIVVLFGFSYSICFWHGP